MGSTCLKQKGWILWVVCPIGPMVSMSCWSYVEPSSVLSVYYDKICLKFASHHFLLYAVYICQKSLNFTYTFKSYLQNLSWLHFSWATQYVFFVNRNVIVYVTAFLSEESVIICQTNSEFWFILNVVMMSAFCISQKLSNSHYVMFWHTYSKLCIVLLHFV